MHLESAKGDLRTWSSIDLGGCPTVSWQRGSGITDNFWEVASRCVCASCSLIASWYGAVHERILEDPAMYNTRK